MAPQSRKPGPHFFQLITTWLELSTPKSVQGAPSGVALAALKVDSWRSACVVSVVKTCEWLYLKIFKHLITRRILVPVLFK